jgi:hypothetical protein
MLRFIALLLVSFLWNAAAFAADKQTPAEKAKVRQAKQQFAAQQQARQKSAHTQKNWAKSQKKSYNKLVKANGKAPKKVSAKVRPVKR